MRKMLLVLTALSAISLTAGCSKKNDAEEGTGAPTQAPIDNNSTAAKNGTAVPPPEGSAPPPGMMKGKKGVIK